MIRINKITPDNIAQLNAEQLVELLRVLLYSEARQRGVSKSGVHVPLQINVADGGEDGRWKADIETSDFIPNVFTVYQCKAEKIGATACQDEVLANRNNNKNEPLRLKSQVEEVLNAGGCYCFFCHSPFVEEDIKERVTKAREALKNAGRANWETDQLAFLDGNKIAGWVNGHAAAIAYVSEACRITQPVTFTNWYTLAKYPQNTALPFESNDYLRERMKTLRDSMSRPNAIGRIVGQSGLGKSRLAFEVFRPVKFSDGSPKNTSLTDSMVCFDFEDCTAEKLEIIRQLAHQGVSGIVVADNCDRPNHDKLSDLVKMQGSNLSLLTLDYEPETISAGFTHIDLEPEPLRDIVPRLLERIPAAMKLSSSQRDYIASFCQGFPQIAFLLAESQAPLSIEALNERDFVKKLLWGRETEDATDLRVIQSLALFRHIGAEGQAARQLRTLCSVFCNGMEEREFRERCRQFQRLRVIQKAGDYWIVTPRPLAIALAAQWWESASAAEIMQILPQIEAEKMIGPFCDQLRLLNFSQNAHKITGELCAPTGFFGNAEALFSKTGSRLFRALVELNPQASLRALKSAFSEKKQKQLKSLDQPRRNLVWALEKLCWEPELFPTAARLLLRLAAAENETCANNATGQFKQLFQLYLSGTETPATKRLDVIEAGFASPDEEEHEVCISALGVALMSAEGRFMRSGGSEIRGSGLPRKDWTPSSLEEIADYQFKAFLMLRDVALGGSKFAAPARAEIGNHLGALIVGVNSKRLIPEFDSMITALRGYWPEARRSIENLLEHFGDGLLAPVLNQLKQWLPKLEPDDIRLKIQQTVIEAGFRHAEGADGHYIDLAAQQAEKLGRELGTRENEWIPYLSDLQRGKQDKTYQFGIGLSATHSAPEKLMQRCLAALAEIPAAERNVSLIGGVLKGAVTANWIDAFLDQVANDVRLVAVLVRLTVLKPLTRTDLERITPLVVAGKIPVQELRQFCYGSVTDALSPSDLIDVFVPLVEQNPAALIPVYEVFAMFAFNDESRWQACQHIIKTLIMKYGFVSGIEGSMHEHQWGDHCEFFLNQPESEVFAENQTRQIVQLQLEGQVGFARGPDKQKVLALALTKHGNVCWPVLGEALLGDNYYRIQDLIRANDHFVRIDPKRMNHEIFQCPIWGLDKNILVNWCKEHPEASHRLLEVVGLFITEQDGSFRWHPLVLALLEECYSEDNEGAVEANLTSFGSSGSRVPYLQRRIDLVKLLDSHSQIHLRNLAQNLLQRLQDEKEEEEKNDEEFSAGIY